MCMHAIDRQLLIRNMGGRKMSRRGSSSSSRDQTARSSNSYSNWSSSVMSIFKLPLAKKQSRMSGEELEPGGTSMIRRVRTSDEDRGRYFAEPDIDRKASDFIAKFYESRVMVDPEHHQTTTMLIKC